MAEVDEGVPADRYPLYTAFVYGEQTWGPLYAEGDGQPLPFADNQAASYISQTLSTFGLSKEDLKGNHVLNIGSGREAMVFQQLGAGQVTHLDISPGNIENTRRFTQRNRVSNLSSICANIEEAELPKEEYDLIFLAGVYQHVQTPPKALIRLSQALKRGGKMYLGFFRSGEWKYFIVDAIRHLISRDLFSCIKSKIALSHTLGEIRHYQMARMLDDFFVPSQHKFHPRDVIHDAGLVGLTVHSFDNDLREYHHEGNGYFSIGGDRIYLTKEGEFPGIDSPDQFRTKRGLNQLTDVPYQEPLIQSNIGLIQRLRTYRDHGMISPDDVAVLAINLYRFTRPFEPERDEYYLRSIRQGRHQTLHEYLTHLARWYGR